MCLNDLDHLIHIGFFFQVMQAVLYHAAQRKHFIEYDYLKPSANNGIIEEIKTKNLIFVFFNSQNNRNIQI